MAAPKFSLWIGFSLSVCLFTSGCAKASDAITIRNTLEECVQLSVPVVTTAKNFTVIELEADVRRSIGDCGCKSASAAYNAQVGNSGAKKLLARGAVDLLNLGKKQLSLPIEADFKPGEGLIRSPITLTLSCAQPD